MKHTYKLGLINDNDEIVREWVIGDENNEEADVLYPITKLGPSALADEINREIEYRENAYETRRPGRSSRKR